MSDPSRVRMTGPLTPFTEGFAAELVRQGYRPNAAANQLQLMAHLSRWLATQGIDAKALTHSVLDDFLAARRTQGYMLWRSPKALIPFLAYWRELGFIPAKPEIERGPAEHLLACYRNYLLDVRGLADSTAREYVHMVRPFVQRRGVDGELDWRAKPLLEARDNHVVILQVRRRRESKKSHGPAWEFRPFAR